MERYLLLQQKLNEMSQIQERNATDRVEIMLEKEKMSDLQCKMKELKENNTQEKKQLQGKIDKLKEKLEKKSRPSPARKRSRRQKRNKIRKETTTDQESSMTTPMKKRARTIRGKNTDLVAEKYKIERIEVKQRKGKSGTIFSDNIS